MSRMTCRPRLPPSLRELWRTSRQGERRGENGFIFVAAIGLGLMVTFARGGILDGGYVSFGDKALTFYVWPVRGGQ